MMIKKLFITTLVLLLVILITAGFFKKSSVMKNSGHLKTGSTAADFIIGMKENTVYKLQDMLAKHFVILSFTDSSDSSFKLEKLITEKINTLSKVKQKIAWFNIRKDSTHAIIEEQTSLLKLRYKTLFSDIPRSYNFPALPSVLIIDSHGIIQFIYVGYSPVVIKDIKSWLDGVR